MSSLNGKSPSESAVNDHVSKLFPNAMNSNATAFGGMPSVHDVVGEKAFATTRMSSAVSFGSTLLFWTKSLA